MSVSPEVGALVRRARRIAVVGLSDDPYRPSHSVAAELQRAGYQIVGVHPAGGTVLGVERHPDLRAAAAAGPIDIVDIFRRSEAIPSLLDDLLAVRPALVWMQLGVEHPATAAALEAAGITVVQDRCLAVELRSIRQGP
jgi:predicted CoA-binding protein